MIDAFILVRWWVYTLIAGLLLGSIILVWIFVLGPWFNQVNYNQYINSPQHLQAVSQQVTKDCKEITQSTTHAEILAIQSDIVNNVSGVDITKINLLPSVRNCVQTAINNGG